LDGDGSAAADLYLTDLYNFGVLPDTLLLYMFSLHGKPPESVFHIKEASAL
jgi:hypothetical protein